ncbi:MAG: YggT family protein [Legionella sp.]
MTGLISVAHFILSLFFSTVIFLLWARIALRYFKVSSLHPFSLSIHACLDPFIMPLAMLLKMDKHPLARFDWLSFDLLIVLELIKFIVFGWLMYGSLIPISSLSLYTLADLVMQPCNLLFYAILIRVVASWINPHLRHPILDLVTLVTNPLLRYCQHRMLMVSGVDLSPLIAVALLKIIMLFISASLPVQLL